MQTQATRTKSALTTGADPELVKTRALDAPAAPKEAPARMSREEFEALSPPERRRAVARDVLAQLEAGTYTAAHLLYAQVDLGGQIADKLDQELGSLSRDRGACFVCGVGSVFVSTMLMSNPALTVGDVMKADAGLAGREERDKVRSTFGQKQLALIETAYEAGNNYGSCSRYGLAGMGERADKFCKDKPRGRPRLEAIMRNIVEHGEFRP